MNKLLLIIITLAVFAGCKKQDFVDANIDPTVVYSVPPENQFLNGSKTIFANDFEAYYEVYRNIMPWLQLNTPLNGNAKNFTEASNPFSRYDNLFGRGGGAYLYDVNVLISKLPDGVKKDSYAQLGAIARILLDFEYFYVSDIYGSIAYTHAFEGRYNSVYTVPFDNQQTIFSGIDADLKNAIAEIKNAPAGQFDIGNYDQFYYGDVSKWIKAANALRLRIAMRLLKKDQSTAESIIKEVLASPSSELMNANDDSWTFKASSSLTSGGNFNPDQLRAAKGMVDFMLKTNDPRTRIFFTKNSYSKENFDLAKAQGLLSNSAVFVDQRYVGSYASPDSSSNTKITNQYYRTRTIAKGSSNLVLDTLSNINPRMFQTAFNGGNGIQYFPLITNADFLFMRAEIAARGIVPGNIEDLYTAGVASSLNYYGEMAVSHQVLDYYLETDAGTQVAAPTQSEITDYLAQPDVKFNPAKALDQIASQSFLNSFKEWNEAWALVKRTGLPNNSTVLKLENLYYNGELLAIPRRAPRTIPNTGDINYQNVTDAYNEMAQDPNYGSGPGDISGRVWWDAP